MKSYTNEEYISNILFERAINSDIINIKNRLEEINNNEYFNIHEFVDIAQAISLIETGDEVANELLDEAFGLYYKYNNKYLDEDLMLEFTGNAEKNKMFIELLKVNDKEMTILSSRLDASIKAMNDILNTLKKVDGIKGEKNSDKVSSIYNSISLISDRHMKAYAAFVDKSNALIPQLQQYDKLASKFNNKYSSITVAEKQKLDKKLSEIEKRTYNVTKEWFNDSKKTKVFDEYLDKFAEFDYDARIRLVSKKINPVYGTIITTYKRILGRSLYIRKTFRLELTKTVRYKIVQKLFK